MCARRLFLLAVVLASVPALRASAQTPVAVATPGTTYSSPPTTTPGLVVYPAAAPVVEAAPVVDGVCGPPGCVWLEGEYLFWYIKGNPTPPLVTTGPANAEQAVAGVLNQPGTRILVGGEHLTDEWTSGFRLRGGFWLDECHHDGVELGGFFLLPIKQSYFVGGDNAVIARPFQSTETNQPAAVLVNYPGLSTGDITIRANTEVYGADAHMVFNLFCCDPDDVAACNAATAPAGYQRLDLLFGYRWLHIADLLRIQEQRRFLADDIFVAGTGLATFDRIEARNDIHAANFVLRYRCQWERLSLTARSALGLGWLNIAGSIDGRTTLALPGASVIDSPFGFLAQPTNRGKHKSQQFTFVPEFELTAGYQATDNIRFQVGWSCLYVSNVLRAGDQIDLRMNPTQFQGAALAGEARPVFPREITDLFLTGVNVGVEVRY